MDGKIPWLLQRTHQGRIPFIHLQSHDDNCKLRLLEITLLSQTPKLNTNLFLAEP